MCLYPRLIDNPKYKATKKNGGNIPPITDDRVKKVPIGCSKCIECRKQVTNQWRIRLLEDIKTNSNAYMITLTFSDQSIKKLTEYIQENTKIQPTGYNLDNAIATTATRLFLERWRKKYKKSLRHWFITELGHNGTENIHIHGIIWTNEPITQTTILQDLWQYGHVNNGKKSKGKIINYVNNETISYLVKYVYKIDELHKNFRAIILTSPGIGNNYHKTWDSKQNKFKGEETNTTYRTLNGYKIAMPIYWRNKIYSETEREKLWLIQLDKNVRYVCGEKVDISKGYHEYDKLVEYYRTKNHQLGYGTNERNYETEEYERQRRILLHKTRINKATTRRAAAPERAAPFG